MSGDNKDSREILSAFLASKGTGLEPLLNEARTSLDLRPNELLLATGSVVEGIGTVKSDLDLVLLTDRDAAMLPECSQLIWVVGRCVVDIGVMPWATLKELMARLDQWKERRWDITRPVDFTLDERLLLHRLRFAVPLAGDPMAAPLNYWEADPAELARLALQIARQAAKPGMVDLAGLREAGDYRSLAYGALDLLGLATDAILAGHLLTNPRPKWRSRLLEHVPHSWEESAGLPASRAGVGDTIWRLGRLPAHWDPPSTLLYAHRIAAFARAAFAWSEGLLLHGQARIAPETAAPPARGGQTLPFLDLDIDFAYCADGVRLGRLNAFEESILISHETFRAILRFDGRTTAREAEALALDSSGTASIEDLLKLCVEKGLVATL